MNIVHISDTHNKHKYVNIQPCDILIHTGDFTSVGYKHEVNDFLEWFMYQPARYRVLIAGNHDKSFDAPIAEFMIDSMNSYESDTNIYLENSGCNIEGINIWGSPVTPTFGHGWAFNKDRGLPINAIWNTIPDNIDILLTHGPAYNRLDTFDGRSVGCRDLSMAIDRVKPKYHLFGHIHETYGTKTIGDTIYSNASICNNRYQAVNKPNIIELWTKRN